MKGGGVGLGVRGWGGVGWGYTPCIACGTFGGKPDVVNQCLEFEVDEDRKREKEMIGGER